MSIQLLITMRQELARRFAKNPSALDVCSITEAASSARLIGAPGFSMRVSVDEAEADQLQRALDSSFVVEPDYAFETFGRPAKLATAAGRTRR